MSQLAFRVPEGEWVGGVYRLTVDVTSGILSQEQAVKLANQFAAFVRGGDFTEQDVSGLRSAAAEWERDGDLRHLWATWLADRIESLLAGAVSP